MITSYIIFLDGIVKKIWENIFYCLEFQNIYLENLLSNETERNR